MTTVYAGADIQRDNSRDWVGQAESQLRVRCREQTKEIKRLEGEVRRLKRELKEANEKAALANTLPMRPARKEAAR